MLTEKAWWLTAAAMMTSSEAPMYHWYHNVKAQAKGMITGFQPEEPVDQTNPTFGLEMVAWNYQKDIKDYLFKSIIRSRKNG